MIPEKFVLTAKDMIRRQNSAGGLSVELVCTMEKDQTSRRKPKTIIVEK